MIGLVMLSVGCLSPEYPELNMTELRVGVAPDFPPFIFKEGRNVVGIDGDCARELAAEMGLRCTFVELSWSDLLSALDAGKVDIVMSAMTITPERTLRVKFSEPVFTISQMAMIRTKDLNKFPDKKAILKSKAKIGVVAETTGDYLVMKQCPHAVRIPFATFQSAVEALDKGEVQVVISDSTSVSQVKNSRFVSLYEPLNEEQLAWAVGRNNAQLLAIVNQIICEWKNDGKLRDIRNKWLSGLIRNKVK